MTIAYQIVTLTIKSLTSLLCNVDVDNGGEGFGLQAGTIKSLRLRQDRTLLTWNRNFTGGIEDFFVTLV